VTRAVQLDSMSVRPLAAWCFESRLPDNNATGPDLRSKRQRAKNRGGTCRLTNVALAAAACISLAACSGIKGFPDRSYNTADELAALSKYQTMAALDAFDAPDNAARGGMTKEGWRNEVLEARIQDMNLQFSKFEQSLYEQGIGFGVGTDWIVLALSGAGAIVTGGASNALSGAAAGVTGARSAYGKDVLYDKTLPVIIAQMVAQRQTVLVRIREGETQDANAYPLTRGLADVEEYYNAGTIPGGISNLAINAGAQSKDAQAQLDSIPVVTVVLADLQKKKEDVAAFVKALSPSDADRLAASLGQPKGGDAQLEILRMIGPATTPAQLNVITTQIKVLFSKEF